VSEVTPQLRLTAIRNGCAIDAPVLNGVELKTCTGLTLTAGPLGIPRLTLELDVTDGLDIQLPVDVRVVKTLVKPRRLFSFHYRLARPWYRRA
jgi:hypothetical protein